MSASGYKGSYVTALLAVVLFLEPCCHCLPVNMPTKIDHKAAREKWWHMPCDTGLELSTKRHPAGPGGQLRSWNRTQTQLKLTGIHYKRLPLKNMYSEVIGVLEEAYNFDWLPEKQLEWFKKEFGKYEDLQEVGPKVLFAMHLALQKFAVTLNKLYHHHHNHPDHHHINDERRQILDGLCMELKKLLCEVEQSLVTSGGDPPSPPLEESDVIPPGKWDDRHDKTANIIQDWGILRSYESFLDDWTSIVEDVLKNTSNGKRKKMKPRERKNRRKGKGNRGLRPGSQEAERSGEERSEGERVRPGRKAGNGAKKRTRGPGGEKRGGKGRKRAAKKQEQKP